MTAVVISQPMLFPWPGFFEQMALADVFLWLDDVQFSKGSFTSRVQVRHGDRIKWLSIPLTGQGSFQSICDLASAGEFRDRHKDFLRQAYSDAPFVGEALAIVEDVYAQRNICDLLIASAEVSALRLGVATKQKRMRTSLMGVPGRSWQRVLDLVLAAGGTRYITGHGAAHYLDHVSFEQAGVAVEYMDYSKTAWPQRGADFTPFVSILDLIAMTGPDAPNFLHPATIAWRSFVAADSSDRR